MTMHHTRLPLFVLVAVIAGCASVGEQDAQAPAPQAVATPSGSAPSSRGVERPGVSGAPSRPGSAAPARPGTKGVPTKSVYFDYDRDELKPESRVVVEDYAKYLRENPKLNVRIEGNADERGSREYNVALGQRRAEAVMKALGLLGVSASRMEAISYGEEKPRLTGHDEASWAENRRDDFVIEAGR
jgi:peptidoglycan-associated lipoprotein